jgi:hypothetical protein
LNLDIKIKAVELLATILYRGYFLLLKKESKQDFFKFVIDELNSAYALTESAYAEKRMYKKFEVKSKKILTSNDEFEKLINFRQVYNFQNEKLFSQVDKDMYKPLIYRYSI